jgi:lysine biosynthesis protein LysW
MAKAICPACKGRLELDRHIEEGEFFYCYSCGVGLELTSLHPLVLDWADDGFEIAGATRHWQGNAKRSRRDRKRGTKTRADRYEEFDYVD